MMIYWLRRNEAHLSTLSKIHNHLLTINSKHLPTNIQQKKSLRQTNTQAYDIP